MSRAHRAKESSGVVAWGRAQHQQVGACSHRLLGRRTLNIGKVVTVPPALALKRHNPVSPRVSLTPPDLPSLHLSCTKGMPVGFQSCHGGPSSCHWCSKLGSLVWDWDPSLLLGGLHSRDCPPDSQPPHAGVGPVPFTPLPSYQSRGEKEAKLGRKRKLKCDITAGMASVTQRPSPSPEI